jgi:polysaccharide export outer membrane protein
MKTSRIFVKAISFKANTTCMKIPHLLLSLVIASAFFFSCTPQRDLTYIENYSDTSKRNVVPFTEPLIQKNDLLSIQVYSDATDEGKTDAMYNLANFGGSASGGVQGFLVNNEGNIQYPRVGTIRAEGLTKPQLADVIKTRLDTFLTNPVVIVRLLNFHITLLGEVAKPGTLSSPSERLTILEAIGLSGDLTQFGKKDDIVVLRDVDGQLEYGKLDLTDNSIFESPYYYLRQNDVVLVNPNKNKARLNEQLFTQRLGIAFSIINTIALLYNVFR